MSTPVDLGGSGLFEQARVEAVAAGQVQDPDSPDVSQDLEQGVALDDLAEWELLGIPVGVGDGVVLLHMGFAGVLGSGAPGRTPFPVGARKDAAPTPLDGQSGTTMW